MTAAVAFDAVSKIYETSGSGSRYALRGVSFEVEAGASVPVTVALEEARAKVTMAPRYQSPVV